MFFLSKKLDSGNLLLIVLMIASVLRLSALDGFSLSNDELSALARLQFDSLSQVIKDGVYVDFHPAGVQVFLYVWTKLFGFGEWLVRFPFAVMGVLSVFVIYKTGELWFGKPTAILASLALAILEYPVLYSQIARPYSPGLLFSLMATYFWTRLLFDKYDDDTFIRKYRLNVIGFVLSVAACMYTHYFSFIFAGILCFSGLFFIKRQTWVPYLLSGLFIVLLYLPHYDLFIFQLAKGGVGGADGWLGPPKTDAFQKYISYCFNDSNELKILFFIILFGSLLAFRGRYKLTRFHLLSVLFFITPFLIAYFYSIYKNPVFQHSVLLFSFPFLLLFIFSFVPKNTGGFTLMVLFYSILAGGVYSTVVEKDYYQTAHFTEFRGIAQKVKYYDEKLGTENITRTTNVFNPYYINYYLDRFDHPAAFEMYTINNPEQQKEFYRVIENANTTFFEYSYSNIFTPPEFDMVIRSKYPWILVNDSMMGSGFKLYSKIQSDSALNKLPFYSHELDFDISSNSSQYRLDSVFSRSGNYSVFVDEQTEFGPGITLSTGSIGCKQGTKVELYMSVLADSPLANAKFVFSINRGEETIIWNAAELGEYYNKAENWFTAFLVVNIDVPLDGTEEIKIYPWNEGKEKFYIDDMRAKFYSR